MDNIDTHIRVLRLKGKLSRVKKMWLLKKGHCTHPKKYLGNKTRLSFD